MAEKKKHHWATFLNGEEDEMLQEFVSFLYEKRELNTKSRYSVVKYLLKLGYDVLYSDDLVDIRDYLYKNKLIKENKLKDAFHYALLYTAQQIKGDDE